MKIRPQKGKTEQVKYFKTIFWTQEKKGSTRLIGAQSIAIDRNDPEATIHLKVVAASKPEFNVLPLLKLWKLWHSRPPCSHKITACYTHKCIRPINIQLNGIKG